jgi:hypothetical protein
MTRRDLLQAGGSGLLGLSLGHLLGSEANSATYAARGPAAKNVILLYLYGAVSQLDTFDPKPDAPIEIRGPFDTIGTSMSGVAISELLPGLAARMHKVTLIRSMTQPTPFHNVAMTVTGIERTTGDMELNPRDARHWPFFGSALSYLEERDRKGPFPSALPQNIILPWRQSGRSPQARAGFLGGSLGTRYDPTAIDFRGDAPADSAMAGKDPYLAIAPDAQFNFPSTRLPEGITVDRFQDRRGLLGQLDQRRRLLDRTSEAESVNFFQDAALRLCDSGEIANALDLEREPQAIREAYGWHLFGQATLAARRMIEAGSRIATVIWDEYAAINSAWDVHVQLKRRMQNDLCPNFDQTFSALIDDLESRGLLNETLVLCLTEHGRTPQPEGDDGRNHWSGVYSVLLAGAGVEQGKVVGASDSHAAYVKDRPIGPNDLLSTIYHLLGLDPHRVIFDRAGRAMPLVAGGQIVTDVLRSGA